VAEAAAALLAFGQQVLQQQSGPDEPTVCFALVPLLVPAVVIVALTATRRIKRMAGRAA
jgi:hypothetical protein